MNYRQKKNNNDNNWGVNKSSSSKSQYSRRKNNNKKSLESQSDDGLLYTKNYKNKERGSVNKSNSYKSSKDLNREKFNFEKYDYSHNDNSQISNDLIWGKHSSLAVFENRNPIHRIWCTSELRSSSKFFQYIKDSKSSGVLVEEVSWARLAQITRGAVHQGIVIQKAASETLDLKKLIKACETFGDSTVLIALDGLTDPHNVGSIIRSAEALGAHGLVLPQRRSAGITGSVAKVAAGALEHIPIARVVNLNRALLDLQKAGFNVIGLAEEGEFTITEAELTGPIVVVIGSEDKGLSLLASKYCDQIVRIPLRGVTTSLNASVATSIVLYEIARNRWMRGISGQAPSPKIQRAKINELN